MAHTMAALASLAIGLVSLALLTWASVHYVSDVLAPEEETDEPRHGHAG